MPPPFLWLLVGGATGAVGVEKGTDLFLLFVLPLGDGKRREEIDLSPFGSGSVELRAERRILRRGFG